MGFALDLAALSPGLRRLPGGFAWYGWFKVRLDPAYKMILEELGDGARSVVDLGAGMGLFEALLLRRVPQVSALAVEADGRKVRIARRLLEDLPGARVVEGDALSADLGAPDAVVLIDLLHYFGEEDQLSLLSRCASSLTPGGVLLVRELSHVGLRGALTHAIERLAVALGWNRASRVRPLPLVRLRAHLEGAGLSVAVRPAGRGPFSGNALIVARKPP